jgi:Zinc carboxypeptidase
MLRRLSVVLLLLVVASGAIAQSAVPTPEQFLGYKLGDRFTPWDRILDYFRELAKQSPLITVQQFGQTYEGRPLVLAVITSPKNRARLEQIRADVVSLGDASTTAARAGEIAANDPAVAWLAFGVHGNESSSSEAAMEVASTLLRDPQSQAILDNAVVIIDPLQNPDGRERYIQWFIRTRGAEADPNPEAFEHQEPWPGGRFNHYLVDMNRDWAWSSQREVQARVAAYRQWNPQVFVDFHEMGWQSTYFFPPDAKPINANLPRDVEKWLDVFGRANAAAFSQKGWPFFVGETFDLFYPAYGDSWPSLHGAIGMTYEVAGHSHAGTAIRREDGTLLTLADRIARHYTSGMATLRTAAAHRQELLRYTFEATQTQLAAAKTAYLVVPGSPNFQSLVDMLGRQSIEMSVLGGAASMKATRIDSDSSETHSFPAGTIVVSTKQPLGRLVQTLFEKSPVFQKGFLEEQRTRTEADEPDQFYDLTSWSLPLAMNVETWTTALPLAAQAQPYATPQPAAFRAASYGYLVDGLDGGIYRLAGALLREGINFSVSEDEVAFGDRTYARGSLIVLKGNNPATLDATLERVARASGATVVPLESGWTGGTAFGSERIHFVRDPRIALVGGPGTSATSYGMLWHTLDIDTPIPHSDLALDSLRGIDFAHYRVLVLPDGNYSRLNKDTIARLQQWVRGGGTLVAVKGASSFLRDKDVELSKLKPWEEPKKKDEKEKDAKDEEKTRYNEFRVPGAGFRTAMSERSFLTFGVPRPPVVLIEGTSAYQPLAHKVDNILTIDAKAPLASGVAWPESLERLKGSPYLTSEPYGSGQVITFADEPNYRLFWRSTLPLFLNAVLYGPSFPREDDR